MYDGSTGAVALPRRGAALLLVVVAAALVIATPSPASACSCIENPPPQLALDQTGAVFAGTVVDVGTAGLGADGDVVARIDVDAVWKGEVAATVEVRTASDGAMCGVSFAEGERWVVYAEAHAVDAFGASLCSRTVRADLAAEDLRMTPTGIAFEVGGTAIEAPVIGRFNAANLLAASSAVSPG